MITCPICKQDAPLNKSGRFAMHRIRNADRYTFCPFSGEPVPGAEPTNTPEDVAC